MPTSTGPVEIFQEYFKKNFEFHTVQSSCLLVLDLLPDTSLMQKTAFETFSKMSTNQDYVYFLLFCARIPFFCLKETSKYSLNLVKGFVSGNSIWETGTRENIPLWICSLEFLVLHLMLSTFQYLLDIIRIFVFQYFVGMVMPFYWLSYFIRFW